MKFNSRRKKSVTFKMDNNNVNKIKYGFETNTIHNDKYNEGDIHFLKKYRILYR